MIEQIKGFLKNIRRSRQHKFTKYRTAPSPQGNHHHRHTQAGKAAPEVVDDVKQDRLWFTDFVSFNHVM